MPWLLCGDATCDTCGHVRVAACTQGDTIEMMRAAGWAHMKGTTLGGQEFETILCPACRRDEKRRTRVKAEMDQEALPLNWEEGRVIGGQGVSSR